MTIIYTGLFIDKAELDRVLADRGLTRRLERPVREPHVTLAYMPEDPHEELFGAEAQIEAFAYGNDGRNEGLAVRVMTEDPQLADLIRTRELPHITLSTAEGAKAVDTVNLEYEPMEPFTVKGVFGGHN